MPEYEKGRIRHRSIRNRNQRKAKSIAEYLRNAYFNYDVEAALTPL